MTRIPVAVQLYSVREDAAKDLAGVLKAIAKMGYDGVEFAGFYGHDAKSVRAMLDEYGLKAEGAHVGINTLMGDELQRSIEFHATIGNSFLIVPGLDHSYTDSRAGRLAGTPPDSPHASQISRAIANAFCKCIRSTLLNVCSILLLCASLPFF